jgi:hypothetical protein
MKSNNLMEVTSDIKLIASCGLYCGACPSYLKGKCPGCKENTKATWCKVRQCCSENNYQSCADCDKTELKDCRKYNNAISKIIGFVLNSDRSACIARIKETGYENFALEMSEFRRQTIKRK